MQMVSGALGSLGFRVGAFMLSLRVLVGGLKNLKRVSVYTVKIRV